MCHWSCLILLLLVIVVVLSRVAMHDTTTEGFAHDPALDPNYAKELQLFQSLSIQDQIEYLNMSKQDKVLQYKQHLA